ncbi:SGF29 tudor-like domain-containing protein [Dipodascopsis uninucleata]
MSTRIRTRPSSQQSAVDGSGETEVWNKISLELKKLLDYASLNEGLRQNAFKLDSIINGNKAKSDAGDSIDTSDGAGDGELASTDYDIDIKTKLNKLDQLKDVYLKQVDYAQAEKRILDQATEDLSVLIALRQASESAAADSKRKKRKMEETPTPEVKNSKKARSSSLPVDIPQKGSQVAFRLKKQKGMEVEWIQCEITKVIGEGSKIRYEVQDPEPDENNNPGQSYKAGLKDIILIPQSSADLSPYPVGTRVLARYPETTTFYRAEVIGTKRDGTCRLKFEGEEEVGKETEVERRLVLEQPR